MNVELLEKVKAHILEEPRRLDMETGLQKVGVDVAPCGTVGCIAGWSCFLMKQVPQPLSSGRISWPDIEEVATQLLGISNYKAENLFHVQGDCGGWPDEFVEIYHKAETPSERAQLTADRIDHFIKTKGAE